MKRFIFVLLSFLLCINLAACAVQPSAQGSSSPATKTPQETILATPSPTATVTSSPTPAELSPSPDVSADKIEVEKGLLSVEVTLPASMLGDNPDIDKITTDAKAQGVAEVIQNADKSITYRMSKAVHSKMLADMKTNFDKTIDGIKTGTDYKTIKDITYNDDFTKMEMTVDRKAFEGSMDGLVVLSMVIVSGYYQAFNGVADYKMTLNYKDSATGEVYDTVLYPDALQSTAK